MISAVHSYEKNASFATGCLQTTVTGDYNETSDFPAILAPAFLVAAFSLLQTRWITEINELITNGAFANSPSIFSIFFLVFLYFLYSICLS